VIADKAFDADERVIETLQRAGKMPVIPPKSQRKNPRDYDKALYKERHLIENFFYNSSSFVPSPRAMIKSRATSSQAFTSWRPSFDLIEDRP